MSIQPAFETGGTATGGDETGGAATGGTETGGTDTASGRRAYRPCQAGLFANA